MTLLPSFDTLREKVHDRTRSVDEWETSIEERLFSKELRPLEVAQLAVEEHPTEGLLLELAAYAAIVEERPDISLRYLKRLNKNFLFPPPTFYSCQAIALAQKGMWSVANELAEKYDLAPQFCHFLFPPGLDLNWARKWLADIWKWRPLEVVKHKVHRASGVSRTKVKPVDSAKDAHGQSAQTSGLTPLSLQPLPLFPAQVPITFTLPDQTSYSLLDAVSGDSVTDYIRRLDLSCLALLRGFDDLLCLRELHGVDHYWYQIETVRKALKQFRGRVLLADEVGLGKTIEAGMLLKEYLMRGMVERVLILTPASLVGQWREEMESKFDIDFITTHDPLLHQDPAAFWSQTRIIASIATARRDVHFEILSKQQVDLVIVDEAQHLKNRASKNWKVVDALQRRFLLLLSATPVENTLIELYNLLTLLKPGIFKTEKEFRSIYVAPGNPRAPTNKERLQELMRDVMIRNTRALVDVRLPARHAMTLTVQPSAEEQACYLELSRMIRSISGQGAGQHRLALHYLLEAAGSSPAAASSALQRFLPHAPSEEWQQLHALYTQLSCGAKTQALLDLLQRNPSEKKMVFVRFRETLHLLDDLLRRAGITFARFDGQMTGLEKDAAIEQFRSTADVLLCTESGGEGRNVQFCNTLINFDLPWNPQVIEQRIGRIHRIGQTREVYVFNLATAHSVEEQILRILDEKINMFELVVGEVQSILGEMEEDRDFANMVFSAWVQETEESRQSEFARLGDQLTEARRQYHQVKAFDDELFGEEFEVV